MKNTGNELRSFLYDELEIADELYRERAYRVRRRQDVNDNCNNTSRLIVAKLLDYQENEETMRRRYNLKDSTYSVREKFSKETVRYLKVYGIKLKSCEKAESMQLLNTIR